MTQAFKHMACAIGTAIFLSCSNDLPHNVEDAYAALPEYIDYNIHVQPILSDRCYQCHGPDENTRKAGLRLDIEEQAFGKLSSGNHAFVRGKPGKSSAIARCLAEDPEFIMPPPDSKLEISAKEIATLYKWLEQGADWKPHWSFIPITRPGVPEVDSEELCTNAIDNFIQRKLADEQMISSPRASKETLLRRVTMDLTGLPPTIEEIDAFLADESVTAYEDVVDRLLASDACAERLALEWMDLARYADSHGVSFDGARTSWPYRDWLIEAFRSNMPYDQFITKQIAGDLLEDGSRDDLIATAFYRMGQLEVSAGSIPEEFRMEYIAERTAVTGTVFLGLTLECARCHDHKFDPITQKEFYQVSAFFNTTPEMGLSPTDADRAPTMYIYKPGQKTVLDSLDLAISAQRLQIELKESELRSLEDYLDEITVDSMPPEPDRFLAFEDFENAEKKRKRGKKDTVDKFEEVIYVDCDTLNLAKLGVTQTDGYKESAALFDEEYDYVSMMECGQYEFTEPFSVSTWINTNKIGTGATQTIIGNSLAYLRDYTGWDLFLDSTNHPRARLIHRLPDDYIDVVATEAVDGQNWTHLAMTYDGCGLAGGINLYIDGRIQQTEVLHNDLKRSIIPRDVVTNDPDTVSLRIGKSRRLWTYDIGMFDGAIDEVGIYSQQLSPHEIAFLASGHTSSDPDLILEHALIHDPVLDSMRNVLRQTISVHHQLLDTTPQMMIMQEMEVPRKSYVLERGLYNEHGEEVTPAGIASVLEYADAYESNRLGLARWLTDKRNPLTARVAINRYWQMIMGTGLVKTAEDFGIQGERPTHPQLLDWLAAEFVENNWDVKHMLKLMVMSSTYCQSSRLRDEDLVKDPYNRFYARGPSYRLQAELIRDHALAVSGLLVNKVGGPPVKPYQPDGLWEELGGSSDVLETYEKDTLDDIYRRSIYTFNRRFVPHPFMTAFDATGREICSVRREITNSPLQALVLLNDPQMIEASRVMSEQLLLRYSDTTEQLINGYRRATGVYPDDEKLEVLKKLHNVSLERFQAAPEQADSLLAVGDMGINAELNKSQIAALTIVTSTILNSDEAYMKR